MQHQRKTPFLFPERASAGAEPRTPEFATPRTFSLADDRLAYGSLFTPLNDTEFRQQIKLLANLVKRSRTFLDIGCGFGNMLAWAREINPALETTGLDVRREPLLHAAKHGAVIQRDAFRYKGYGDYDLLYMYRPMVEFRDQLSLEHHVIGQMRNGATLISLLPAHHLLCGAGARGVYTKAD